MACSCIGVGEISWSQRSGGNAGLCSSSIYHAGKLGLESEMDTHPERKLYHFMYKMTPGAL